MSAITAIAKALFNMFFQSWNNPWSSSISFLLYSNCCIIFLLVIHLRFDGYSHILLNIVVSSCVNRVRTLRKKLIHSDIPTLFSGFCNGTTTTLNSFGLFSGYGRPKIVGSNAKGEKVCTVELDPGEAPSLYQSKEEEEEEEERPQQLRWKQLEKEDQIKDRCSSRQRSNIQCKDTFEILIQKLNEYEEDNGSFDETLAFWRRKEMEEIISRRKLKY